MSLETMFAFYILVVVFYSIFNVWINLRILRDRSTFTRQAEILHQNWKDSEDKARLYKIMYENCKKKPPTSEAE